MFGMKKVQPPKNGDQLIRQVTDLLFPAFETREVEGEKYSIDSSVDTNVEAVLSDLRDGYMDEVCVDTLQAIFDKLYRVRELLNAFHEMDPEVSKYIIAMDPGDSVVDKVEAEEEDL